jgi:carboxyl-terminal processing protease
LTAGVAYFCNAAGKGKKKSKSNGKGKGKGKGKPDTIEEKEEEVDAVIVDLRNNGGGSLSEANQLVGLFIETGATVQIRYSGLRNGFTRSFGDNDPDVAYMGPLAVLVNRTSASASEIFAGAIQDYQRGIVLGGQTFGKGTVQEIIPMDYGQVKLTRSKFYRISGESTQHRGVIPDISFPDFYDAYEDIGESSLDGALPWDTVRAVEYTPYHAIQALVPELQQRYDERAESSPDFIYLRDQIERARVMRQREQLSLNEQEVKEEREETRRTEFDAENMRRLLKGLTLNEWIEDLNAEEEEEELVANSDTPTADEAEEGAVEDEGDPLILESGRILADFIALNSNSVSSVSPENTRQNR